VFKLLHKDPHSLLKEATAQKKAGDVENAIRLLRKAYQKISKGSTMYPVNTFLRLPLYLQEAKRNDEAWREFNRLLARGYPNQINNPELIPMDHSVIYDKMRLFLQREGKNELAVRFGIFSYLSYAIGLYRQERHNELKTYTSREAVKNTVRGLLKKAKKEGVLDKVCAIVEEEIRRLPDIDFEELAKRISGLVFE